MTVYFVLRINPTAAALLHRRGRIAALDLMRHIVTITTIIRPCRCCASAKGGLRIRATNVFTTGATDPCTLVLIDKV